MLETNTGIEIKIPMEEYNTKDNVEIIEEPGGGSTIIIKNIENVKLNNQIKIRAKSGLNWFGEKFLKTLIFGNFKKS